jgi:hypothetical protein
VAGLLEVRRQVVGRCVKAYRRQGSDAPLAEAVGYAVDLADMALMAEDGVSDGLP